MDRRDFLISGTGALAAGAAGCASFGELIVPSGHNISPAEMDHFLTRLDGAMNGIARESVSGDFLGELPGRRFNEKEARLFRQGMRSLLLVGNFGDLSVSGQTHPGVQQRLRYSMPEVDWAVWGLTDRIASLSPTARADIKSALHKDPDLADRVLEAIDTESAAVGVPFRRRLQLRAMGKHIARRLRHSPGMLIDEYVTKCHKVAAQSGSITEMQRQMAAHIGAEAFRARVKEAEAGARRWQTMGVQESPIGYQLLQDEEAGGAGSEGDTEGEDAGTEASDAWYRKGARVCGFGVVATVVGLLLIGVGNSTNTDVLTVPGVILGITVGPIALLSGLIILLMGALIDLGDGP